MLLSYGCPIIVKPLVLAQLMQQKRWEAWQAQDYLERQVTNPVRLVLVRGQHLLISTDQGGVYSQLTYDAQGKIVVLVTGFSRERRTLPVLQFLAGEQRLFSRVVQDSAGAWHWCGPLLQPLPVCVAWDGPLMTWGVQEGGLIPQVECADCQQAYLAWMKKKLANSPGVKATRSLGGGLIAPSQGLVTSASHPVTDSPLDKDCSNA